MLRLLLEHGGADIDAVSDDGESAVAIAHHLARLSSIPPAHCAQGGTACVAILLAYGAARADDVPMPSRLDLVATLVLAVIMSVRNALPVFRELGATRDTVLPTHVALAHALTRAAKHLDNAELAAAIRLAMDLAGVSIARTDVRDLAAAIVSLLDKA